MRTRVETYEYDDKGNVTKMTVTETETADAPAYPYPVPIPWVRRWDDWRVTYGTTTTSVPPGTQSITYN